MKGRFGRVRDVVREFFAGFVVLGRGFAFWRKRPGLMALGLVPAALVALALLTLLAVLSYSLGKFGFTLQGFNDAREALTSGVFQSAIGVLVFAITLVVSAFAFTAVTLIAGEKIYTRIWHAMEVELGDLPEATEPGFWHAVGDAGRLVLQAIVLAVVVGLLALIPYVGPPLAAVLGFFLSARIIALELTARPLEARGMTRQQRNTVLRTRNPRLIGYGVAVHFFYGIPLGAVLVMPAAVAAATILARHAVESQSGLRFDNEQA